MNNIVKCCSFLIVSLMPVVFAVGQDYETSINSYGLALPKESVSIKPNVESRVSKLLVTEGQRVKKGEVLVELSCDAAIARKKIAQLAADESGSRMKAQAEQKYASENFKKLQALFKRKAVNDKEFNEAKLRLESAKAALQIEVELESANQAKFELALAELQDYYLRAPFDGQVSMLNVSTGSAVSQSTDILQLISSDTLRVELYVAIKDTSRFKLGDKMKLILQKPFSNHKIDGRVVFLSPIIEATTGTIRMVLEIDNSSLKLPAGFTVSLSE